MPKKYLVFDLYDCRGAICECDTLEDAEVGAGMWEAETDGECDLIIQKWSDTYQVYTGLEKMN